MNTRYRVLILSMAGALFAATACSAETPPAPATVTVSPSSSAPALPTEPDVKIVAWLDGMCGTVNDYRNANNDHASKQQSGRVVTKRNLSEDLEALGGFAGKAIDQLNAVPPSPIPGGDEAKKSLLDKYTAARDAAVEGKRKLDASKGDAGLDAGLAAFEAAQKPHSESADPFVSLKMDTDEVAFAMGKAKKCLSSS